MTEPNAVEEAMRRPQPGYPEGIAAAYPEPVEPVYEYRVNLYHPNAGLKTWDAQKDFELAKSMLETALRFDRNATLERRVYTPWEKVSPNEQGR